MYPSEWLITAPAGQGTASGGMGGGGYGGGNNQGGAQGNNNCGHQEQGRCNAGGGAGARWQQQQRQPWVDDRHPRIIAMMTDYVAAKGLRVRLTDILNATNKRITDLPTIPEYVANGCSFVCWAHILGHCTFDNCQFKTGHVPRSAIPDTFAEEVVAMLTPGVNHCVQAREKEGSPGKWQRAKGHA
jgi:hypothetical protein